MSGVGKTAVVNQLITSLPDYNNEDIACYVWSMEMSASRLAGRSISHDTGKTVKQLYVESTDADIKYIKDKIIPRYHNRDIWYEEHQMFPETVGFKIEEFCKTRTKKKVLVVYDHSLLVMRKGGVTERDGLFKLLSLFNSIKKKYDVQFIVLSQLNRSIEDPVRKSNPAMHYPVKSDIFGGESSFQFSDVVIALHDPYGKCGISKYGPNKVNTRGFLFAHILKARDSVSAGRVVFKNTVGLNKIVQLTDKELIENGFKKKP